MHALSTLKDAALHRRRPVCANVQNIPGYTTNLAPSSGVLIGLIHSISQNTVAGGTLHTKEWFALRRMPDWQYRLSGLKTFLWVFRFRREDGNVVWMRVNGAAMREGSGLHGHGFRSKADFTAP